MEYDFWLKVDVGCTRCRDRTIDKVQTHVIDSRYCYSNRDGAIRGNKWIVVDETKMNTIVYELGT